jgi:hypothetical protein
MKPAHFRAPWSWRVLLVTAACLLILAFGYTESSGWTSGLIVSIPVVGLIFAVRGYTVDGSTLLIHRLGWSSTIDLGDLQDAYVSPHATMGSLRMLGNGGLFGYFGWFRNAVLGSYRAYGTNEANTVVLEFPDRTIVVTPEDPPSFVTAVNERAGQPLAG